MKRRYKSSCNPPSCDPEAAYARENYYFGKMLTARGLQSEQQYLNEKRWLINRYGIGWGVLCGLKVVPDPNNPCNVIVQPGMALDRYGHEILVNKPYVVSLQGHCEKSTEGEDKETENDTLCIKIRYKECRSDPSPIPVEECGHLETQCAYNRTIETYKIEVSRTRPETPKSVRAELDEVLRCERECAWFLHDPSSAVIEKCPPREKWCELTLACVCCREGVPIRDYHIDNTSYRKLAFSNELLYELISCLRKEVWEAKGARSDRRRYVPLLANTIKGLAYRDGKNAEIKDAGVHPNRLTSDGEVIWVTDQGGSELVRIKRQDNTVIKDVTVDLKCCDETIESSWGIAFDGRYMWITHNNPGSGRLTRIDTCDLTDCWSFQALPACEELDACQKYCIDRASPNLKDIPEFPQEVVYHNHLLYVAHGCPPPSTPVQTAVQQYEDPAPPVLRISIIDTQRCCLLKTVTIDSDDKDDSIPVGGIAAMASDGEALWITYKASYGGRDLPVVRYVKYFPNSGQCKVGRAQFILKGCTPERMAFDGSHLWVTHDDGVTKTELYSPVHPHNLDRRVEQRIRPCHCDRENKQTAIAYGGSDDIWSAEFTKTEARLNRIDIHSARWKSEIEIMGTSGNEECVITDAQFDGTFIYVSGYYLDATEKKRGVLHRILP